jgi:nicotinate-nucleotide adenylyltransferase
VTRLGLLGRTFDPPHYGHLVAAQEAADALQLDRVLFLPAGQPPHKRGRRISPVELRIAMVRAAIRGNRRFRLCLADVDRPGPSYSVGLLDALRQSLGTEAELFFLIGMDSLRDLLSWREPERLLELCTLVAVQRPGVDPVDPASLERELPGASRRILVLRTPGVDVSSSDLRARAASGRTLRYLLPEAVRRIVERERLYRGQRPNADSAELLAGVTRYSGDEARSAQEK